MLVPRTISAFAARHLPRPILQSLRNIYAVYLGWLCKRVNRRLLTMLFPEGSLEVRRGPFQGMRYLRESCGSVLVPKLLGSYEAEIQGFIEEAIGRNYATIINLGCGEGYYAVGLARRLPEAHVVAFDTDPAARESTRRLAELNRVADRITIAGSCTHRALEDTIQGKAWILSDCEGAEFDLLDPEAVPALRRSDLLVEMHDFLVPGVSEQLGRRFAPSHEAQWVSAEPRDPGNDPILHGLSRTDRQWAVEELRPPGMLWAWFKARDHSIHSPPQS